MNNNQSIETGPIAIIINWNRSNSNYNQLKQVRYE